MIPHYIDESVTLWHGDSLAVLRELPAQSVNCCVTSPPYFGLRDYGVVGQYGLEASPAEYVETMRSLFSEVRRVLADDGTLWLNIGDSYAANPGQRKSTDKAGPKQVSKRGSTSAPSRSIEGLAAKNLMGIPWRVAFALQDDGWILRNDIIWAKPNGMPESVTDRLSTKHEHFFMFAKSPRYWFDLDPIREAAADRDDFATWPERKAKGGRFSTSNNRGLGTTSEGGPGSLAPNPMGKNPGDVWSIPTQPFSEAHFAVMPQALASRAIQAGCKPAGKGCDCAEVVATPVGTGEREADPSMQAGRAGMNRPRRADEGTRLITRREQRGHAEQLRTHPHRAEIETRCGSAFAHYIRTDRSGARPLPPDVFAWLDEQGWLNTVPTCEHPVGSAGVVLDPFSGSGTTGLAAAKHGRKYVGIDLSADYLDLSLRTRLAQTTLDFGEPA